jgi:hypothetical protein
LEERQAAGKPSAAWWALCVVNRIMEDIGQVFVSLQGLTTVVSQQEYLIEELCRTLQQTVAAEKCDIFVQDHSGDNDNSAFRLGGCSITPSAAEEFINDQGSFVGTLFSSLDSENSQHEKQSCLKSTAILALELIDGISNICSATTSRGSRRLPPVVPRELANMRTHAFISGVLEEQVARLLVTKDRQYVHEIESEHRAFLKAVQMEKDLRDGLREQSNKLDFSDAWAVCQKRFPKLQEFWGGLSTVFPGTATVESDFSIVNWEKSDYRSALSDLTSEVILHCKQFEAAAELVE